MRCRVRSRRVALLGVSLLALAGAPAAAQELLRLPFADEVGPALSLGGSLRSASSPYRHEDPVLDLVPLFLAETRWFFAHGNEAGLHLRRGPRWRFDLLARYRFDGLEPDRSRPELGRLRERKHSLDAGIAAEYRADWGELRAVLLTDTLSRHRGQELELSYRRRWQFGDWQWLPYLSLSYQDRDLVGHYFGVEPEESVPGLAVYRPGGSVNLTLGLNTGYRLTPTIVLHANAAVRR
ncbi:MAG: MipA/OmpV family protein, partial [Gammaproteobacteria bacterium]